MDFANVDDAFLGTYKDGDFREVRRLSREEACAYGEASARLRAHERDQFPFACVVQSYQELQAAQRHYAEADKAAQWSNSMQAASQVALHLNRLIMNYLSSIRAFLDHSETRFKRTFGEDSPAFRDLKSTMALHFDNSFSYPFVYELRNYAQHCGLPMGTFEVSARESPRGSKNVEHSMTLCFVRDQLLSNYQKWKPKLKADIAAKPEQWDVSPDLEYMMGAMTDVHATVLDNTIAPVLADARLIERFEHEIPEKAAHKFVGRVEPAGSGAWRLSMDELPLHIVELVFADHRNLQE